MRRCAVGRKRIACGLAAASPSAGEGPQAFNTSLLIDDRGHIRGQYRKLHLFDAELPDGTRIQESAALAPGSEVTCTATTLATFGQAICYDLRFPELFRSLADRGMTVLLLSSAWTQATGPDHWELLVRARAVENQCFVIAANQTGQHAPRSFSYGHSLIVDPWGRVLAKTDGGARQSSTRRSILTPGRRRPFAPAGAETPAERLVVTCSLPANQH